MTNEDEIFFVSVANDNWLRIEDQWRSVSYSAGSPNKLGSCIPTYRWKRDEATSLEVTFRSRVGGLHARGHSETRTHDIQACGTDADRWLCDAGITRASRLQECARRCCIRSAAGATPKARAGAMSSLKFHQQT